MVVDLAKSVNALEELLEALDRRRKTKVLKPLVARVEKDMQGVFSEQEKQFLQGLATQREQFAEAIPKGKLNKVFGNMEAATNEMMAKAIAKGTQLSLWLGASHRIGDVGIDIAFDLKHPKATAYVAEHAAEMVTNINSTTRDEIARIITQATGEGWSYNKTAKEISTRFDEFRIGKPQEHIQSRAHLVAVTEAGNGYEQGGRMAIDQMVEQGLEMEKKWLTVGDDRVSDGCQENASAGWIPVDDLFPSGDLHPLRFPGCRCDCLYRRRPK